MRYKAEMAARRTRSKGLAVAVTGPTGEAPARGTGRHYYSAQKAEVEGLLADALFGSATAAYVFRPCIVAGPKAPLLIDSLPYTQISDRLPGPVLNLLDGVPILKPVLPDTGVPFQLVHHDDVASAMRAAVLGRGAPGIYNLAGPGEVTVKQLADELGWYSIPVPELAVDAAAPEAVTVKLACDFGAPSPSVTSATYCPGCRVVCASLLLPVGTSASNTIEPNL